MKAGQGAIWQAVAPAGLTIVGATFPANSIQSYQVNDGTNGQFGGDFYWSGGRSNIVPGEHSASFGPFSSSDFGWLLVCGVPTCTYQANLQIFQVNLAVRETTPPALGVAAGGIWQAPRWVRGRWPLLFWGGSPSGMCGLNAYFGGSHLPGTSSARDTSRWQQCLAWPVSDQIVTQDYGQGANELYVSGWDAAGETVSQAKTVYVDNQPPAVSLSGPSDASSTAGTQYVTATASAGPSGVSGIACRVDSGPGRWYPASMASIPVSGVGEHSVACQSENKALNSSGQRATSASATFSMKIGQPTVSAVAFTRLVNGLRCRRSTTRVRVPAHWVRVQRGGRTVRLRRAATTRLVHVRRCHVRTQRRRVTIWVTVRRHGHKVRIREHKLVRVVLQPRRVISTHKFVAHGRSTTVNGWLGMANGIALAGQTVDVLTAPEDGRSGYALAATVTSAADGSWTARIPPGPSRLITAAFAGGPTTEASLAAPVQMVVPAKVKLVHVSPRQVAWGATVRLTGQLVGGYLPPGGALVRLRIGLGRTFITYGVHEHVGGSGRFRTSYTFGAGDPAIHRTYWFEIASLPMGDYPYAPSSSGRISVTVGGHPRPPRRR
ncbi:MAG: hypothetical protein QOF83_3442 [Solirubrobacteraceae bacterium]|jgi:hypothetical protein|nr:hypothetical protein [Solirubrobacteraceae bacterium]